MQDAVLELALAFHDMVRRFFVCGDSSLGYWTRSLIRLDCQLQTVGAIGRDTHVFLRSPSFDRNRIFFAGESDLFAIETAIERERSADD